MDIISTFNPPRMVMFGERVFWCRAISQEDYAVLVAWLDDVLPGQSDRTMPPKLSSEEATAALNSPMGWTVLAWVALRHCDVSYGVAADLILRATDVEKARLSTVLFRKRPTYKPVGDGSDLGEAWWGPQIARLSERGLSVSQIGAMTLDQVDMLLSDGLEREQPGRLTFEQVQAMWEASQAKAEANGDAE